MVSLTYFLDSKQKCPFIWISIYFQVIDPWGTVIAKMSRRDEFGISCSRFGIFEKSATRNTRFHSPPTRRLPITHLCFSYFTAATRRGYILFRSGEFQRMGSVLPESTCTLWLLSTVNASFLDVRSRCDSNAIFVPSFNFLKIHFRYFFRLVGDAFETDKTDTRHAAR
jgi:hypothetical protein